MLVAWQGDGSESWGKGGGVGTFGLAVVGSNYWIIIDPSCGSKCSSGAQHAWMQTWRRAGDIPPQLRASTYFPFAPREEPPTVANGFNSKGGSLAGGKARLCESRGDDKWQAREARKRTSSSLNTMDHRDVEADATLWYQPEPL